MSPYVDLNTIHNPGANSPPATWGDQVRENLEWLATKPSVRVVRNSTFQVYGGTLAGVPWNTADDWDTHGFHDPASNNTKVTIPTDCGGKYRVSVEWYWGAGNDLDANNHYRQIFLAKNCAATTGIAGSYGVGDCVQRTVSYLRQTPVWFISAAAGDTFQLVSNHDNTGSYYNAEPFAGSNLSMTFEWVSR